MSDNFLELKEVLGERVKESEPMALHTTFKIGGPARFYFEAKEVKEIVEAVTLCQKLSLPYFILGGGSNILTSDAGFPGLVIKNKAEKIKIAGYQGKIQKLERKVDKLFIEAESGVLMNTLVRYSLEEGLSGLEYFLGLPGTVGGAVYINAHFKNNFVGDCLEKAKILGKDGKIREVDNYYFHFAYDQSILQKTGEVLLSVILKLTGGDKDALWQAAQVALELRRKNHHYDMPSAGCIFRNISKVDALRLGTPDLTQSAGFLIEASGLKGKAIGGAQFSSVHANFIVNCGSAKAADVIELINLAKAKVKEKFGVNLKEEVVCLGG
ncbi:MAG: UDP-N-acetylmuramate dehydrogenase [bacterium]|nr:UDP-N-acetylmuramate dehydrogenase [bacterium]